MLDLAPERPARPAPWSSKPRSGLESPRAHRAPAATAASSRRPPRPRLRPGGDQLGQGDEAERTLARWRRLDVRQDRLGLGHPASRCVAGRKGQQLPGLALADRLPLSPECLRFRLGRLGWRYVHSQREPEQPDSRRHRFALGTPFRTDSRRSILSPHPVRYKRSSGKSRTGRPRRSGAQCGRRTRTARDPSLSGCLPALGERSLP